MLQSSISAITEFRIIPACLPSDGVFDTRNERTVKACLDSIYNKLGVDSRAAAVSLATQRGILPRSDS